MQSSYAYGRWIAVAISILFFTIFAVGFLVPIKKREWRSLGIFEAFIVALYVEMFGFPLTIYILLSIFGKDILGSHPFSHHSGHLLATLFLGRRWAMLPCFLGILLIYGGLIILGIGWWKIYRSRGNLVTDNIYKYVRHPQYLGLIMITVGMLIQWPTLPTIFMWPILVIAYYRLARREEKDLEERFGKAYQQYRDRTRALIPFLRFNRVEIKMDGSDERR